MVWPSESVTITNGMAGSTSNTGMLITCSLRFTMITPMAPADTQFQYFHWNRQPPRSTTQYLPATSSGFTRPVGASAACTSWLHA